VVRAPPSRLDVRMNRMRTKTRIKAGPCPGGACSST
jgi:hypothetical protein